MKSIKFLLVLLLSAGFMTGCFEQEDKTYQGPVVVEFAPAPGSSNSYVRTVNIPTSGTATIPVPIQLVGPHQGSDTQVTFTVGGTATAGLFSISGTTATIPANSSTGNINVVVDAAGWASLASAQTRTVVLTLTGGTFQPSEKYKVFTLTLRKP